MDINAAIQNAIDNNIETKLPELIEKYAGNMLESIISNVFSSYSDVGKKIKEQIEQDIKVNLGELNLIDYNVLVAKAISDTLLDATNESCIKPIQKLTQQIVGVVNAKEVKLSDIYDRFRDSIMTDSTDSSGEFTFVVKQQPEYQWVTVYMDEDKDVKEYNAAIRFVLSLKDGTIFSMTCDSHKMDRPSSLVSMGNLEKEIFRYYVAQTKIIVDETDFEQEWYLGD